MALRHVPWVILNAVMQWTFTLSIKKMSKFLHFSSALFLLLFSCQPTSEKELKEIEIAQVNLSADKQENAQIARDVNSFDFRALVSERLNITDTSILNAIQWTEQSAEGSKGVKIKLMLGQKARPYEDKLEKLMRDFTDEKIKEYGLKNASLPEAEKAALFYLQLIATGNIDSVWLQTAPNLTKFASKSDFNTTLLQRQQLFHPEGKRFIANRRISQQIGTELKGDFCTITFIYENNEREEVTLEKLNGKYKLLGYQFLVIPRN